ncbi:uncharacterized protein LOC124136871 isoform X1 [Haliotis rufescens]|uniref:uncharacterized protein LOC124136871 isoform X1 n=2 Tax=Haliotis rufescens TaxID=6454 RepID=UPI00201EE746|nr:uncharacterized protein LOC124136871 isoform X1 [Haliotis rufescens]
MSDSENIVNMPEALPRWARTSLGAGAGCALLMSMYLMFSTRKKKSRTNIVVFSRYPTPGATKTRLVSELGPGGAARAQRYMSEHLFSELTKFQSNGDSPAPHVTVSYSGATEPQMDRWLQRRFAKMDVSWSPQMPGLCLGEKLAYAFRESFSQNHTYTIVIGSDIPGITTDILKEAMTLLHSPSTDVVLGKAEDGGYYLIGMQDSCKGLVDELFKGIKWGSEEVFQQQAVACRRLNLKVHLLPTVLNDVDYPEDLPVLEAKVGVPRSELKHPHWSVIIPTYNEADNIARTLRDLLRRVSSTDNIAEIVVSDGGSSDDTVQICQEFARSSPVKVKVVSSKPGRGIQQQTGVMASTGSLLLFLHADTLLPQDFDVLSCEALATPGNVASAFNLDFDGLHPEYRKSLGLPVPGWLTCCGLKIVRPFANTFCNMTEDPHGDQALMMTRKMYDRVGGFDPVLLMEDYMLVRKLHKMGHVVTLPQSVITSSRRFETKGVFKTTFINRSVIMLYNLGVDPDTLAQLYYGKKLKKE